MSLRTKLSKIAALSKRLSIHNVARALYWLFHEDFHSFRDRLNRHALIARSEQSELELDRVEAFDWDACEPLVFPKREHPIVSILVPVYNQIDYTYACLKSVLTHSGDVSYEVILADDASTDATKDIERKIKNIVVVRNETNLRFLRNCNNAARRARGKYLLFLNNDTQVQPDWLAPLCAVLDDDPSAGATGGMLIYPDGRLQEAGGIIWRDASGANYGHGDNPALSDYNYRKEVDYISGASLMVRKSLWDRLGGFDDRFSPAYYEDTDLCFSIRALGFKVVYQPLSRVVHFEGVSNGTDLSSGQKRHQVENQVKFREKWKDVLDREHFEPGQDEFLARDRGGGKRRLFVLDHLVPAYDADAGGRCTWRYLKLFLEKGFRITFLADNFHDPQPYTREMQQLGIDVVYGSRYCHNWKTWLPTVARYFDFAFLQRPYDTIRYIDLLKEHSRAKIVYFGHDLHFLRERRQYELEHDEALLKASEESRRIEFEIFSKADVVFCVGSYERKIISDAFPGKPVYDIPLYFYDAPTEPHPDPEACRDLLFVGGFNHKPNRDCVLWFAKEVFPKIRKELPGVKWRVVGSNPPPQVKALASDDLIIAGFVSDEELSRLYATSRIAVVPLRYGAGVKGKVVEALRFGIPLVTTSIGAEGIPSDAPLALADDAEAFADAVIRLYRSPELCRELSAKCASFIERNYSADKAKEILREVMPDEEERQRNKPTRSATE